MSANNGVIRISRKGVKKFAFGEDGAPFEVDIVSAYQEWSVIDESFRVAAGEGIREEDVGTVAPADMPAYHAAMVEFVKRLAGGAGDDITPAETFDFIARMREQYDEVAVFFRARSREERASPGTSGEGSPDTSAKTELRFSTEAT
jgi:hypothetical protein